MKPGEGQMLNQGLSEPQMLGLTWGKSQRAMEIPTLQGALFWLPNPVLMLGLLGCSSPVFQPLGHCSPASHPPFGKPQELLTGEKLLGRSADGCGNIPAWEAQGLFVFPSLVSLPREGGRFGDFVLSCKFGMDLCVMEGTRGGAGLDEVEVSSSGALIWHRHVSASLKAGLINPA